MKYRFLSVLCFCVALLASCVKEQDAVYQNNQQSIGFRAYTSGQVSKGVIANLPEVFGAEDSKGIGVFAFYQPASGGAKMNFNSHRFPTPDFMYNQKVGYWDTSLSEWVWDYAPLKYWPNEKGEQISFFAYAPYDRSTAWEDLGISTDASGTKITATIPIGSRKDAMKDVFWADPQLNQSGQNEDGANNISKMIEFNFRHALSKLTLNIGVTDNLAAGPWKYAKTDITVEKIVFTSLAENYIFSQTIGDSPVISWTAMGSRDLTLSGDDFRNNVITKDLWDADYWAGIASPTYFKDILALEKNAEGVDSPAALFLAPQEFETGVHKVSITYTVKTTDPLNSLNNAVTTNTITRELADILPLLSGSDTAHGLESGKAYALNFLIGMGSVTMSSGFVDWDSPETEIEHDIPAKFPIDIYSCFADNLAVSDISCNGTGKGLDGEDVSFTVSTSAAGFTLKGVLGNRQNTSDNARTVFALGTDYEVSGTGPYQVVLHIKETGLHHLPLTVEVAPTEGECEVEGPTGRTKCSWVRLYDADSTVYGPFYATFNVGSTADSYENGDSDKSFIGGYYNWGCFSEHSDGTYSDSFTLYTFWEEEISTDLYEDRDGHYPTDNLAFAHYGDAAMYLWGRNWRLPSIIESKRMMAIYDADAEPYCVVESVDGSNSASRFAPGCTLSGVRITGKKEFDGTSLFIPAAGYKEGNVLNDASNIYQLTDQNASATEYRVVSASSMVTKNRTVGTNVRAVLNVNPFTIKEIE